MGKTCKNSIPCGDSCISKGKKCKQGLPGQAATAAQWLTYLNDNAGLAQLTETQKVTKIIPGTATIYMEEL